ncbi:hypothetical protein [Spirosoma utsteinense]|uniref:Lipoprotein n=1 Tax=Spirosoma utsteinense TaxID=2585773 RepID=A0ABR6W254_9BACT|nr:hypothetical protein [Spirosoma utsteinense]MBC3785988.1 hypothetical protein [Spirosoma utsteinense]MBC3790686.1 hypothetical protein [Spirosoma utsteinense]
MLKIVAAVTVIAFLSACEGGVLKKKNCKSCETITYSRTAPVNTNKQQVCGNDEVSAFVTANTITTSSLTVVTTCN